MANPTPPTDTAAPAETKKAKLVTATATCDLFEAGNRYANGETFKTSPERGAALGDTVTIG